MRAKGPVQCVTEGKITPMLESGQRMHIRGVPIGIRAGITKTMGTPHMHMVVVPMGINIYDTYFLDKKGSFATRINTKYTTHNQPTTIIKMNTCGSGVLIFVGSSCK